MMTALSAVIGIVCKNFFTWNVYYRITFENLPVIFTGFCFGPIWGAAVGFAADAVSCLASKNPALNPLISLGAITVGLCSGLMPLILRGKKRNVKLAFSVASAHLFGQVLIKSIGKILFFEMPTIGILLGLAFSVVIGTVEFFLLQNLLNNKELNGFLKNLISHD